MHREQRQRDDRRGDHRARRGPRPADHRRRDRDRGSARSGCADTASSRARAISTAGPSLPRPKRSRRPARRARSADQRAPNGPTTCPQPRRRDARHKAAQPARAERSATGRIPRQRIDGGPDARSLRQDAWPRQRLRRARRPRRRRCREIDATLAAALADRHTGIGCDQLILLEPSDAADFRMRIFNADGGEVEGLRQRHPRGRAAARRRRRRSRPWAACFRPPRPMAASRSTWACRASNGTASPSPMRWTRLRMPVGWEELEEPGRGQRRQSARGLLRRRLRRGRSRAAWPADRARPAVSRAGQRQRRHRHRRAMPSACACGSAAPA